MASTDQWEVGTKLSVTTTLDEEFEAFVYAHDSSAGVAFLEETDPSAQKKSIRVVNLSCVKNTKVLSSPKTPVDISDIPTINNALIQARENSSIKEIQQEIARVGVGVSEEAQDIFNALEFT